MLYACELVIDMRLHNKDVGSKEESVDNISSR